MLVHAIIIIVAFNVGLVLIQMHSVRQEEKALLARLDKKKSDFLKIDDVRKGGDTHDNAKI